MSIEENISQIKDDFDFLPDWEEKYGYIIELGKSLGGMDAALKTEHRLIKGCQSNVWLHPSKEGQQYHFIADSDAIITRGLIALLLKVYNDKTALEIKSAPTNWLDEIGLHEHLSPNRSNGLRSMLQQILAYAAN